MYSVKTMSRFESKTIVFFERLGGGYKITVHENNCDIEALYFMDETVAMGVFVDLTLKETKVA